MNAFGDKGLDLNESSPFADVKKSDAITMIATQDKGFLRKYEHFFDMEKALRSQQQEESILNPIYRRSKGRYKIMFPSDFYENEYYMIKDIFPHTIGIDTPMDELKRKLVFIPVPGNFKKEGEQLSIRLYR